MGTDEAQQCSRGAAAAAANASAIPIANWSQIGETHFARYSIGGEDEIVGVMA